MARAPEWKVYDAAGEYQAACKEVEAAASLLGFYGEGSTIRFNHRLTLWVEGSESQPASESFDFVSDTIAKRMVLRLNR